MSHYLGLMAIAMAEFHTLPAEQRIGAYKMMALISNELWHMQFDDKLRLDTRTLIKTLDDIQTNLLEDITVA
jgi:hypothetical protein